MAVSELAKARVEKLKNWSPVWVVPIVTLFIGCWIIFYHFSHQGPEVILVTTNAEGIKAGKTAIKSRSVDVGKVESVALSSDLSKVIIKARLNSGMEKLLRKDSVFWVVKPQVGKEGISGLSTLLSGAYIQLQPGKEKSTQDIFNLLDSPPLASPDAQGIRVILVSKQSGQLSPGDPVLFHGFKVGSIESSKFDPSNRSIQYQLFIAAPYDRLVTTNVRFWQDSGITLDMSAEGVKVKMGSLSTLFTGGISFDIPDGWSIGKPAKDNAEYTLFPDQNSIKSSLFTRHQDFLLLFDQSIRGLQSGAPVEFRGVRLGTVAVVPFLLPQAQPNNIQDYRIPVLIRIEPDRLEGKLGSHFDLQKYLASTEKTGLRATLKTANLLTGALYIDLDFYPKASIWKGPKKLDGYSVIPTETAGFEQIQDKFSQLLTKLNRLPLGDTVKELNMSLADGQKTLQQMQITLNRINAILATQQIQNLPEDIHHTLKQLNDSLQGFQPGSPAYNRILDDMQRFDQTLKQLQPLLKTLNKKSNALIFQAPSNKDPYPRKE